MVAVSNDFELGGDKVVSLGGDKVVSSEVAKG